MPGPVENTLIRNNTYLFTIVTLDLLTSLVSASTNGIGIALSALVC
ncbi:MAG: DUF554 family protein [Lacrimispora sp.]